MTYWNLCPCTIEWLRACSQVLSISLRLCGDLFNSGHPTCEQAYHKLSDLCCSTVDLVIRIRHIDMLICILGRRRLSNEGC